MSAQLQERLTAELLGIIGSILLRVTRALTSWEYVGFEGVTEAWADGPPRILLFWHGQQLLMPWVYLPWTRGRRKAMHVLISSHRDGQRVAACMRWLGIGSVSGSSTRRGREAMFELLRRLERGEHIAITPDGPRGPACKVKRGVVGIAQRSGVPIYPCALWATRTWRFRSWDGMFLPKPFSKIVLIMGDPISVAADSSGTGAEAALDHIEAQLNAVCRRAAGHFTNKTPESGGARSGVGRSR